jgi:hypothetical protein
VNQVAHELARQALVSKVSYTWFDSQPTFITALLANDVTIYLMNKACHLALSKKKNKLGAQVRAGPARVLMDLDGTQESQLNIIFALEPV